MPTSTKLSQALPSLRKAQETVGNSATCSSPRVPWRRWSLFYWVVWTCSQRPQSRAFLLLGTRGLGGTDSHEFLRIGDGGYTIPWLHLTQLNVPTTYDLAGLSLGDFHQALKESTVNGSSRVSSAHTSESHGGSSVSSALSVATGGIELAGVETTSPSPSPSTR